MLAKLPTAPPTPFYFPHTRACCPRYTKHQAGPLPAIDLGLLVPLPALKTPCGEGVGMAVCPTLGLLVTSSTKGNTLSVFTLPDTGASSGAGAGCLALVCTLGGVGSAAPMRFRFPDSVGDSGWMAFTGPPTARLLLVTDAGHDAVHVIDVACRLHAGYVAAPGTIAGPRGVAARGSLVAVTSWKSRGSGDHVVRVFEGSGATWTPVRVLAGGFGRPGRAAGQLRSPYGLRFTSDGTGLVVADGGNDRVSLFRVEDGSFVRHVAVGLDRPIDVEECESGWLVVRFPVHTIEFVDGGVDGGVARVGRASLGKYGTGDGVFCCPLALALVPGLGLVVRELGNYGRLQFFATPDTIAMASMSASRVGWMVAVARGGAFRAFSTTRHRKQAGPTGKRRRQRVSGARS
jgi:hypothetical protein